MYLLQLRTHFVKNFVNFDNDASNDCQKKNLVFVDVCERNPIDELKGL